MATEDPFLAQLVAQYGQQTSAPQPTLTPIQQGIMGGQVAPQDLVPDARYGYSPQMAQTAPNLTGLPGNPANQLALQAAPPAPTGNVNPIPASTSPIEVPAPKALPSARLALPAAGESTASLGSAAASTATGAAPLASQALGTGMEASAAGGLGAAQTEMAAAASTGLLAKINTMFPSLGLEVSKASIMEGAGVAMAGLVAGGFADHLNIGGENSNFDLGISGGIKGLGLGGAAAIALGLSGPVGWAVAGGAALFGVANAIFGGRTGDQQGHRSTVDQMHFAINKANHTVDSLIANPQFGVDQWTAQQIRTQVAASTQFYLDQKDKAGLSQYLSGLATTVPSFLMQASQRNQVVQEKLKMQAAFGPVYSSMVERSANAGQQAYADQMKAAAAVSDPGLRASLQGQAGASYKANQNLLTAQAQQVAMLPGSTGANPATQQAPQTSPQAQQVDVNTQSLMNQYMTPAR